MCKSYITNHSQQVHNKTEFIGHVVTHTCLDMNILSVAEMSDDEENTIETDSLSRLPTFDVSASLWQRINKMRRRIWNPCHFKN